MSKLNLLNKHESRDFKKMILESQNPYFVFDVSDTMNYWFQYIMEGFTYEEKKVFVKKWEWLFIESMHSFPDFDWWEVDEYLRFYRLAKKNFVELIEKNWDLLELIPF